MTVVAPPLDLVAVTRSDLSAALAVVNLPLYEEEGPSHDAPCILMGRPSISRPDPVVTAVEWPLKLLLNPKTPVESQHLADRYLWETWEALGGGGNVILDRREYAVDRADPGLETHGDQEYPTYTINVIFGVHSTFCG